MMGSAAHASSGHGKICYLEIPARDATASSDFYHAVFGWPIRRRNDGSIAFDDTVGAVSGAFVLDREPAGVPGIISYIMVRDARAACESIVAHAGEIVRPIDPNSHVITAWFRDPGGNILGVYEHEDK